MAKAKAAAAPTTKYVYVTRGNYAGQFLQMEESMAAAANGDQWGISGFTEGADGADPTGFNTSIPDGWDISPYNLPQSLTDFQDSILPPPIDNGDEGGDGGNGNEEPPIPVLSSLDPATAEIGGEDIVMKAIGENFTADTRIFFGGGQENTVFVSATEVTTIVKPSTAAVAVSVPVYVQTGDNQSGSIDFTFTEAEEET